LPSSTGECGLKLLALLRPGDMMDNTPVDFLLEDSNVELDLLYIADDLPVPQSLPDHDVLIVAIGESDQNQALLKQASALLKWSPRPILNAPQSIARLSRPAVSKLLNALPGLEIPLTLRLTRTDLALIARGEKSIHEVLPDGFFPVIIRPLGSHAGEGLAKIDSATGIAHYLDSHLNNEFTVARFVDYRGSDGMYRKCRIALIDGEPYACHLAVSDQWMIHYKTAGMSESITKRDEEARFMADFDNDFGLRHHEAFRAIHQRLTMDYLVIDCAETADGKLLIFEADNLGLAHAMDPPEIFPYKPAQMRKVFVAFHEMLKKAKGLLPR
jgi:hypothetical protein